MTLTTDTLPSLINGVSQQPATLRLPTQVEEQINFFSSEVDGLRRRAPFDFQKVVPGLDASTFAIHAINRDNVERYLVALKDGDLLVYDTQGNAKTVNFPNGKGYLATAGKDPRKMFSALTVADHTYVLNRDVTVAMDPERLAAYPQNALVVVKQGNYGRGYRVTISDERGVYSAYHLTPDGGAASHSTKIDTTFIASQLETLLRDGSSDSYTVPTGMTAVMINRFTGRSKKYAAYKYVPGLKVYFRSGDRNSPIVAEGTVHEWHGTAGRLVVKDLVGTITAGLNIHHTYPFKFWYGTINLNIDALAGSVFASGSNTNMLLPSDYTVTRVGHVVHIERSVEGQKFAISTEDGFGGNALVAIKDSVQKFSDLPSVGVDGMRTTVKGDNADGEDDYYVRFVPDGPTAGGGVWEEVAGPDLEYRINPATMPHVLVREADGTFTFRQVEWADRAAGDDLTNPKASFVGRKCNALFLHRNRLGIMSAESFTFSEAGEFHNFWRTTATTTLDADRIDGVVSTNQVAVLRAAVPYNERLMMFSESVQLALLSSESFTPNSIRAEPVSYFPMNPDIAPVLAGSHIYFAAEREGATVMYAFGLGPDGTFQGDDVTGHCPMYVPKNLYRLTSSPRHNLIVALSRDAPHAIYTYKFLFAGQERVQSAWSRWELPEGTEVLACEFFDDLVAVFARRGSETCLLTLTMDHKAVDTDARYSTAVDYRVAESRMAKTYYPADPANGWPERTRVILPFKYVPGTRVVARTDALSELEPPALLPVMVRNGTAAEGDWVEVEGDWTQLKFYVGTPMVSKAKLSPVFVREQNNGMVSAVLGGRLQVRTQRIRFSGTGAFRVEVTPKLRRTYKYEFSPYAQAGKTPTIGDVVIVEQGEFRWTVACRNTEVDVWIINDSPLPSTFQGLNWEGFFVPPAQGPN